MKAHCRKRIVVHYVVWAFVSILFSSCATLINERTVTVNVYTDVDSAMVSVQGQEGYYQTPASIELLRSKRDVVLTVKKDTLEKNAVLPSNLSVAFVAGNLFSGGLLGYAIDLTNNKMFTYPKENYVSLSGERYTGSPQKVKTYLKPPVKHQLNLKFAIPEGNLFYLRKQHGYGNSAGFLGISTGFEYFLSDRYSINMDIGTMTDFIIPFPAPVDYEGSYNRTFASYLDVQFGRDYRRFHFDLGLQGNRTTYIERETVELFPDYIDTLKYNIRQYNAGLALSGYYKVTNGFNLGLNYYPSALTWHQGQFEPHYAHLIMFELLFRVPVYKPNALRTGAGK